MRIINTAERDRDGDGERVILYREWRREINSHATQAPHTLLIADSAPIS